MNPIKKKYKNIRNEVVIEINIFSFHTFLILSRYCSLSFVILSLFRSETNQTRQTGFGEGKFFYYVYYVHEIELKSSLTFLKETLKFKAQHKE